MPHLTPRQEQVLSLLSHGLTNKEIAEELGISTHTAKKHVSDILNALEVKNRTAAARKEGYVRRN